MNLRLLTLFSLFLPLFLHANTTYSQKKKNITRKKSPTQSTKKTHSTSPKKRSIDETGEMIEKIQIQGLRRFDPKKIQGHYIYSQRGDILSLEVLRSDIWRLRQSGLFTKINVHMKRKNGLVTLIFQLKEHPEWIRAIYFNGNTLLSSRYLLHQLPIRKNTPFQKKKLALSARKIIKEYHKFGYFRVRVTVRGQWLQKKSPRDLILWFIIEENHPANIRYIHFKGNKSIKTATLKKLLLSKAKTTANVVTGRTFYHPSLIANDLYFLKNFYYDKGFLQVRIPHPRIEVSRDRYWVDLTYNIQEGPQYFYGDISFYGDLILPAPKLKKLFKIKPGAPFNRSALYKNGILPLLRRYQDAGYAYAQIRPIPTPSPMMPLLLDLRLSIKKGPLVRIEKIEITGNKTTRTAIIRRQILFKKGDLYSATKLQKSQINIYRLGFFQPTDKRLGTKVVLRRGSKNDRAILRFIVAEKNTWIYPIPSFGYLPGFGFLVSMGLGKMNFLGLGQTLMARGLISSSLRIWNAYLYFIEPHLLGSDLYLSTSFYRTHYEPAVVGFAREQTEARLFLAHPLPLRGLQLGLSYRIGKTSIAMSGKGHSLRHIAGYEGSWMTSSFKTSLQIGSRYFSVGPAKMWNTLSIEQSAQFLGADYNLTRLEALTRWYFPLKNQMMLRFALSLGWLISEEKSHFIPTNERYFLGGAYSLRGYALETIAPTRAIPLNADSDFSTGPLFWGGNKKFLFNAEFEFPLIKELKLTGVLFFDAGNIFSQNHLLFDDPEHPNLPLGLFMNLGFGIHINLPNTGIMRLEWGIPLSPRKGIDSPIMFSLTVGSTIF